MDDTLLGFYTRHWKRFTVSASTLNHIFQYLNRHWVKREIDEGHRNVYEIYILALVAWRDHLFMQMHDKIVNAALKVIARQRNGETVDSILIKGIVDSFVSLGMDENDSKKSTLDVFKTYFEEPFLVATDAFYRQESESFVSQNPVTEYLKKAEARLAEEERRVDMYLHPSTHKPLIQRCEVALLSAHLTVIQDEFQPLLDHDRVDDLARMYALLSRVPEGLDRLRDIFEAHVRTQGNDSVLKVVEAANSVAIKEEDDDEADTPTAKRKSAAARKQQEKADLDPKSYVDALLAVYNKYSDLVSTAFRGEPRFVASLDKACREFVNNNAACTGATNKSPELLARYCDSLLRKSSKTAEDAETELLLNSVMVVFKFVDDKDVFQKFYSKHLAKRLVNGLSSSGDSEESMISKLKDVCGFEYTNKLSRMFTDMGVSKDLNEGFKEQMERTHDQQDLLDFNILVLGTANWPLQPQTTGFNLPEDLLKTYDRFQRFYNNKHSGRKMNWLFHLCRGELKTNYVKSSSKVGYTLQVSTFEMAILLMFNGETSFMFQEIKETTGLTSEALVGQLGILIRAKILLLEGEPGSGRYSLNMDFKSKKVRINLNLAVKSEQKADTEDTHRTIEEDRKLLIQAAIVRIMKTRKTLKHVALMNEVIAQLQTRFKPKVADIKKCIDILLEKEYIQRHEDEKDLYDYVA